jgi:hypothetical protein
MPDIIGPDVAAREKLCFFSQHARQAELRHPHRDETREVRSGKNLKVCEGSVQYTGLNWSQKKSSLPAC